MSSIARIECFTERPAVGTRVILQEGRVEGKAWDRVEQDTHGTVIDHRSAETVRVRFDNGNEDWGAWDVLLREPHTPAVPTEITLDGVRYTLTPVQDATAEPEPKRGEVWHDENGIWLLVTDEKDGNHDPRVTDLDGDEPGKTGFQWRGAMTYGFPDLRAAIAAGVL